MWQVATTDEFDAWFAELGEDVQVEIIAKVELLKLFGPKLARPHADTLNGSKHANMKELRADAGGQTLRIAFAFDPGRKALVLERTIGAETRKVEISNMAKSFDALAKRTASKKTRDRAARRTQELVAEMLLSELRERTGKSQSQLAETLGIKQPSLSKLEKQSDIQVSTLRKIVRALGGELEIVARFPGVTAKITQFSAPADRQTARRRLKSDMRPA